MILTASNTEEFLTRASGVGSVALNNTMQRLLDKLKEFIENDVYSYNNKWYTRTGELEENWEFDNAQIISNGVVSSTLHGIDNKFSHDDDLWWHGNSRYNSLIDIMDVMAEIVNDGKIGDIAGFPDIGERPFWDDFLDWVDTNIDNIFMEECNKIGLTMVSVSHSS